MVSEDRNPAGARSYVSSTEGAPPLPPKGGYHGASRATVHTRAVAEPRLETATLQRNRVRSHWLGWVALSLAIVFALVLVVMAFSGAADAVFSVTVFVVQLAVIAAVVAALVTKRARRLGIAALAVVLLCNVATVGSLGVLQTASAGSYAVSKSTGQLHREAFPGVEDYSEQEILAQPSLEAERDRVAKVFEQVRDRLSRDYGVTWTKTSDEQVKPERNGQGGESMLKQVTFEGWTTNEPVHDLKQKRDMIATADEVLMANNAAGLISMNEYESGLPAARMKDLYGSVKPDEQAIWDYLSWDGWQPTRLYVGITDLSRDPTGDFRAAAEARRLNPSDPVDGFTLNAYSTPLLAEGDVKEFKERMRGY
ncbi:hypothetical protein G7068_07675 [Leucobacter viscericola]|uniref:Uncharacterized protein n=1 Tax=Leucobacter viscericola TaxID=2714935 RepID=A0A6G7XFE5_9MICO|nr:hypothetical protein [Leucobacter viscericola]QIK63091.1 hypothetical protein G7068_07675 [Leucobacter viscericola]